MFRIPEWLMNIEIINSKNPEFLIWLIDVTDLMVWYLLKIHGSIRHGWFMHFHDGERRIENLLSYTYKFLHIVRMINNQNMILIETKKK